MVFNFAGEASGVIVNVAEDGTTVIKTQPVSDYTSYGYGVFDTYAADADGITTENITGVVEGSVLTFDTGWSIIYWASSTQYVWFGLMSETTITLNEEVWEVPVIEDVAAMPADPEVVRINPYSAESGYGSVVVTIPNVDVDGFLLKESSKTRASNAMAYYPDTMTFKVLDKRTTDALTVWESGAQDVFSFPRGSDLVMEGQISSGATQTTQRNPRCAIGMVEPGHYVIIVADGRQPGYSIGFRLKELAELLLKEGCVEAFNLDGGISTSICFMGVKLNHHGDEAGTGAIVDLKQRRLPEGLAWGYSPLVGTFGTEN